MIKLSVCKSRKANLPTINFKIFSTQLFLSPRSNRRNIKFQYEKCQQKEKRKIDKFHCAKIPCLSVFFRHYVDCVYEVKCFVENVSLLKFIQVVCFGGGSTSVVARLDDRENCRL